MRNYFLTALFLLISFMSALFAQNASVTTEIWKPVPNVITPGTTNTDAPSDAIVLFNGSSATAWQHSDGSESKWVIAGNVLTVTPGSGALQTKQKFGDCQLHIEWRTPAEIKGDGQARGNSGVFMMGRYEIQIMDSYNNPTFSNGQAGSVYKQHIPLVNACKPPGEWQSFDIIFAAPRFSDTGSLLEPARVTILQNGVLVQNNVFIWGSVTNTGMPKYEKHAAKESLSLQDHNNPMSFRNIWIREL